VVARGAVLRAFNKDHGPDRITSCSYGFLRSEPYEPEEFAAHKNTRCIIDKADGEKYIDGTINWLIQKVCTLYSHIRISDLFRPWLILAIHSSLKGEPLPHNKEFSITVKHTFGPKARYFSCKEVLYVSDFSHESHYRKTHVMNKGK
jgi:hypothetical protein